MLSVYTVILSKKRVKIIYYKKDQQKCVYSIANRLEETKSYVDHVFKKAFKLIESLDPKGIITETEKDLISVLINCNVIKIRYRAGNEIKFKRFKYINKDFQNIIDEGKRYAEALVRDFEVQGVGDLEIKAL